MASYYSDGDKLDYTPTTGVAAGEIVVLGGTLVTMAERPIAANDLGAVLTNGIVTGPVFTTGVTGAQGAAIKWYATSGVFDASTGVNAGYLARARLAADRTVAVLLWPGS
jgi:predicted RecA/RadA family phage recombinase